MPNEQNFIADLLSKIASSKISRYSWIVIQEALASASIEVDEICTL